MSINLIIKHLDKIARGTIVVSNLGCNLMKDRGEIKTLPKPRSNEKSHLYLDGIGDIVHCDIAYGTGSVIRGT